jgi:large subunit ribosomal protein L9
MEVILLEKVENLGRVGERVTVKPGYARNYLIPKGRAVLATPENVAEVEAKRVDLEKAAAQALTSASERVEALKDVVVTISGRAGTEGRLFGSVGTGDIAHAITQASGVQVEKHEVRLPEGPLRQIGEYEIALHLHSEVNTTVKVIVVAED